jgi:hypothetical protein
MAQLTHQFPDSECRTTACPPADSILACRHHNRSKLMKVVSSALQFSEEESATLCASGQSDVWVSPGAVVIVLAPHRDSSPLLDG